RQERGVRLLAHQIEGSPRDLVRLGIGGVRVQMCSGPGKHRGVGPVGALVTVSSPHGYFVEADARLLGCPAVRPGAGVFTLSASSAGDSPSSAEMGPLGSKLE